MNYHGDSYKYFRQIQNRRVAMKYKNYTVLCVYLVLYNADEVLTCSPSLHCPVVLGVQM